MDPISAQQLSLRLFPRFLRHAQRSGWAPPRQITSQALSQLQIAVGLLIITAPVGSGAAPITAARDNIPRPEPTIFATLRNLDKQMDTYERQDLLDLAREEIPLQRIRAEATAIQQSDKPLPCEEDALAQALVQWFKHEYFKWADPIKCSSCRGNTQVSGMVPPTEYERAGGAGRVELHVCTSENGSCNGSVRFPRYNDLKYLMRTRLGRCGEWANLYTLFLRAVGLRARYVWNAEDHVWNMYFSPASGRWLHTDSCEAARDEPLLYDKGWGKKMSYIIAFSVDGATDELAKITAARRRNAGPRKESLEAEDATERAWLLASDERAAAPEQPPEEEPQSRISGTQEWKEARGEAGPKDKDSDSPPA